MSSRPALAELQPGETFAGFVIERLVGRGGMGVVYQAREPHLARAVALKVLAPELCSDARFRERFERKSRLAASIEHAHVLPVYAAGETAGRLFIAMRYVDGDDLGSMLARKGPLGPDEAMRLLKQLAAALDAAHDRAGPGDRERAGVLLGECVAACREIGMPVLEAKAASLVD